MIALMSLFVMMTAKEPFRHLLQISSRFFEFVFHSLVSESIGESSGLEELFRIVIKLCQINCIYLLC